MSMWSGGRVPGEVELAFARAGSGPDPVLCLHGITAQHRSFNALARRLATSREVLAPDLRGRGDSQKPETGYGLEAHARDVIQLLDHLGLQRAAVIGHSMGAFVGLRLALEAPERVEALILLDGGWPRAGRTAPEEMTDQEKQEAEAVQEGLRHSFSRLEMVFESPEAYLDFWFPGQALTMDDLPPELADYCRYDLAEVEGGYTPKASAAAVAQDAPQVSENAPTKEEMREVECPVALIRASEGFFAGSQPLISAQARAEMGKSLDLRSDTLLVGANHYTMLWGEHVQKASSSIEDFLHSLHHG